MRRVFALLILTVATLVLGAPAMAIEQPRYSVVMTEGDFELRRYQPYIVAEVVVSGDQGKAVQQGFRKLAGYIFGGNTGKSKIAMTAPVMQRAQGEKIAMTSPVIQVPQGQGRWTVQFMMPSAYTMETLPKPDDADIHFLTEPTRKLAVLRFSGVAHDRNYREKTEDLRRWMSTKRLIGQGGAALDQYDPPWTIWFIRRNEVLIEVGL